MMMLAYERLVHEEQLRADLQQYYGIDWDDAMRGAHSPYHVACLVKHLPGDARLRVAGNADNAWTLENVLSASLLNSLNGLIYGLSDRKKRGSPPEPVGPSWMRKARTRSLPARVLAVDELMDELRKPRR